MGREKYWSFYAMDWPNVFYFRYHNLCADVVRFAANNVEAQSLFQSGWFIEGLLSQTLVVHMLRTQKIPFIQSRATLPVLLTTGLIMAIGIYIPFSPLGAMVGLEPLPLSYFRGWWRHY